MSVVKESIISPTAKLYKDVKVVSSEVGDCSSVGDFSNLHKTKLGSFVQVNRNCVLDRSEMGTGSYINYNTTLKNAIVGRFCCISWNVCIYGGSSHNYHTPSMYSAYHWKHIFGSTVGEGTWEDKSQTTIGNDVWVGNGAIIINGVTVGDGAIIGAGAVVTKDVPPYSIVVGIPARVIKKRFKDAVIERLLNLQWWDWPLEVIGQNEELLRNAELTDDNLLKLESIKASIV